MAASKKIIEIKGEPEAVEQALALLRVFKAVSVHEPRPVVPVPPTPDAVVEDVDTGLQRDFSTASLGDLAAEFTPNIPDAAVKRLEDIIRHAQENRPEDQKGFVRDVNCILGVNRFYIRLDGGDKYARLKFLPKNKKEPGTIQFRFDATCGSFKKPQIEIVPKP